MSNIASDRFVGTRIKTNSIVLEVSEVIGEGRYGFVYSARDLNNDSILYAIKKVLINNGDIKEQTKKEVTFLEMCQGSSNILTFYDSSEFRNNELLIVTERCQKGSVADIFSVYTKGSLDINTATSIFYQCALSIKHIQSVKPIIIHRDIKLENYLLSMDGKVKLCDFGSATTNPILPSNDWSYDKKQVVENELNQCTTPLFRPPEICDMYLCFPIDHRMDIWALGCILFVLCFNQHAFPEASKLGISNASFRIPRSFNTSFTPHVDVIKNILKKNPNDRMSIQSILQEIENLSMSNNIKLFDRLNVTNQKITASSLNNNIEVMDHLNVIDSKMNGSLLNNSMPELSNIQESKETTDNFHDMFQSKNQKMLSTAFNIHNKMKIAATTLGTNLQKVATQKATKIKNFTDSFSNKVRSNADINIDEQFIFFYVSTNINILISMNLMKKIKHPNEVKAIFNNAIIGNMNFIKDHFSLDDCQCFLTLVDGSKNTSTQNIFHNYPNSFEFQFTNKPNLSTFLQLIHRILIQFNADNHKNIFIFIKDSVFSLLCLVVILNLTLKSLNLNDALKSSAKFFCMSIDKYKKFIGKSYLRYLTYLEQIIYHKNYNLQFKPISINSIFFSPIPSIINGVRKTFNGVAKLCNNTKPSTSYDNCKMVNKETIEFECHSTVVGDVTISILHKEDGCDSPNTNSNLIIVANVYFNTFAQSTLLSGDVSSDKLHFNWDTISFNENIFNDVLISSDYCNNNNLGLTIHFQVDDLASMEHGNELKTLLQAISKIIHHSNLEESDVNCRLNKSKSMPLVINSVAQTDLIDKGSMKPNNLIDFDDVTVETISNRNIESNNNINNYNDEFNIAIKVRDEFGSFNQKTFVNEDSQADELIFFSQLKQNTLQNNSNFETETKSSEISSLFSNSLFNNFSTNTNTNLKNNNNDNNDANSNIINNIWNRKQDQFSTKNVSYDSLTSSPLDFLNMNTSSIIAPLLNQSQSFYQPTQSQPSYQPNQTQPSYQPNQSQPSYQPNQSQPSYQPTQSQTFYQPTQSQTFYQPTQSQPSYQPNNPKVLNDRSTNFEANQKFVDPFGDLLGNFGRSNQNTPLKKSLNETKQIQNLLIESDPIRKKIYDWSNGKQKKIKLLLSTLHLVIWDVGDQWVPLSIHQLSTPNDVKKYYRKAVLLLHPDKQRSNDKIELARAIFIELNEAWSIYENNPI